MCGDRPKDSAPRGSDARPGGWGKTPKAGAAEGSRRGAGTWDFSPSSSCTKERVLASVGHRGVHADVTRLGFPLPCCPAALLHAHGGSRLATTRGTLPAAEGGGAWTTPLLFR